MKQEPCESVTNGTNTQKVDMNKENLISFTEESRIQKYSLSDLKLYKSSQVFQIEPPSLAHSNPSLLLYHQIYSTIGPFHLTNSNSNPFPKIETVTNRE
jgi:hypothetical protein